MPKISSYPDSTPDDNTKFVAVKGGVNIGPLWSTLKTALNALYDAQTILAATTDNTPTARTIGEAQIVGRQTGGNIAGIAQVSAGEKTAGTETALRGFSPDDVKAMIDTHGGGGGGSAFAMTLLFGG